MQQTQEKHLAGRIHKAHRIADPKVSAHDAGVGEVGLVGVGFSTPLTRCDQGIQLL